MKKIAFVIILPSFNSLIFSQISITGKVIDQNNEPIEYAKAFLTTQKRLLWLAIFRLSKKSVINISYR